MEAQKLQAQTIQYQVVLVESNATNLSLLQSMLRRLGNVNPIIFMDPQEALAWCEINHPDLILVDYSLPLMDGIEFISLFRKLSGCELIPLVMISAVYDKDVLFRALEQGANDFLTKPVDRYELLARTRNMLTLRESQLKIANQTALLESEIERATADLKHSEERYALAARGANDGLWDWDLTGEKVFYSFRWKAMLGYEENDISSKPDEWFKRVHPSDIDQLQVDIGAHLQGATDHFENEYRIRHRDGSYKWVLSRGLAVRDDFGQATRFVGSQTDIHERKNAEQRLLHDAFHDNLTGLPNRSLFIDRVNQGFARKERIAVLFMDLDRFKYVNDTMGHKAGDELLIVLARRLERCCRAGDTTARFGGDEFTILLTNVQDDQEVQNFANRLLQEVGELVTINGHEIFPTLSIGIAISSDGHYTRAEELIRDADIAMYKAKENGKGCFALFDEAMRSEAVSMFKLEANLRRAIERQEILLYYQPIVDLKTGYIAGFEALMRWDNPNHGIVSPDEFIPLAEETKLIVPLGQWALRQACIELAHWLRLFPDRPKFFMTVNVSGKQLEGRDFTQDLLPVLNETAIEASLLKLEVTETIIMDDPDAAEAMLRHIKSLGVNLAIDDFGTGYSSLSYLHRFPFDTLKIDKSFVEKMLESEKHFDTVKIITMLASSLGMNVVAEGVEDERALGKLRELGCTYGQGYLFSRPVTSDKIIKMLDENMCWLQ